MFNKIKRAFIVAELIYIMMTVFFVLFIPTIYSIGWFSELLVGLDLDAITILVTIIVMVFGALFICLAIDIKVINIFNEIFKFDEKYENLKQG